MAQHCSICDHEAKNEIDRALMGRFTLREIERQYGVSKSALDRHRRQHLAPQIANSLARSEVIDADRLSSWLIGVNEQAMAALLRTRADQDYVMFRALLAEVRKNLELLGRFGGVIGDGPQVAIDARRQVAVLANLSEEDLRALARGGQAIEGVAGELPVTVDA